MNEGARMANEQMHRRRVEDKLDKIIALLELHNSIGKARVELINPNYAMSPFGDPEIFTDTRICNCSQKGKTSAIVACPLHG